MDIAELGIKVDATSVVAADKALDNLTATASKTETAIARLSAIQQKAQAYQNKAALDAAKLRTEYEKQATQVALTERATQQAVAAMTAARQAEKLATDMATLSAQKLTTERAKGIAADKQAQTAAEMLAVAKHKVAEADSKAAAAAAAANAAKSKEAAALLATEAAATRLEATKRRLATQTEKTTTAVKKMGNDSYEARNKMLTLQYTINDVIASLGSGASPMTVFFQQGGQVTQAWGGVGNTLKAVASTMLTVKGVVIALAAAVVGWAVAINAGQADLAEFNNQLLLTMNYAGLTFGSMKEMSRGIADDFNTSIGKATEAVSAFADSGKYSRQQTEMMAASAVQFSKISGESLEDVLKSWEKAAEGPTKFAQQFSFLSATQYEQIKILEDQGKKTEALDLLSQSLYGYLGTQAPQNLGYLASAWQSVGNWASRAWDAVKQFGREDTTQESIAAIQKEIASIERRRIQYKEPTGGSKRYEQLQQELQVLQSQVREESRLADAQARNAKETADKKAAIDELDKSFGSLIKNQSTANQQIAKLDALIAKVGADSETGKKFLAQREAIVKAIKAQNTASSQTVDVYREQEAALRKQLAAEEQFSEVDKVRIELSKEKYDKLSAGQKEQLLNIAREIAAKKQLEKIDKAVDAHTEEKIKAAKALNEAYHKEAMELQNKVEAAQRELDVLNTSEKAVEALELARMRELLVIKQANPQLYDSAEAYEYETESLKKQIKTREELNKLRKQIKVAEEAKRLEQEMSGAIKGFFTNLVTDGKSAFKTFATDVRDMLVKSLVDSFYDAKLKETVNSFAKWLANTIFGDKSTGGGIANMFSNMFGQAGKGGGFDISSAQSWISAGKSLWSGFSSLFGTGAVTAGQVAGGAAVAGAPPMAAMGAGGAQTAAGMSAGGGSGMLSSLGAMWPLAVIAGMFGSSKAYDEGFRNQQSAWGNGAGGAVLKGIGDFFTAQPLLEKIVGGKTASILTGTSLAQKILSPLMGETRGGGQYGYAFNGQAINARRGTTVAGTGATFLEGPAGGQIAGDQVKEAITNTVGSINNILKALGSAATLTGFQAGLETSDKGRGGVFSGGMLSTGALFGESGAGSNYEGTLFEKTSSQSVNAQQALENFSADLMQVTIQALQAATDIPKTISDKLKGVDAESLSAEAAGKLLQEISDQIVLVNAFGEAVKLLPFENLKNLSFDATSQLLEMNGGIEGFTQKLTFFYDNFYTEAQKTEQTTKNLKTAFDALGLSVPASREAFAALVEAQDLTTEKGRETYSALLDLAQMFAAVNDPIKDVTASVDELGAAMQDLIGMRAQIADIRGSALDQALEIGVSTGAFGISRKDQTFVAGQRLWNAREAAVASKTDKELIANAMKYKDAVMNYHNAQMNELKDRQSAEEADFNKRLSQARQLAEAQQRQFENEMRAAESLNNVYLSLKATAEQLLLSELSPRTVTQQADIAKDQFNSLLARAQSGDTGALSMLGQSGQQYLQKYMAQFPRASAEYASEFDRVQGALAGFGAKAQDPNALTAAYTQQIANAAFDSAKFDAEFAAMQAGWKEEEKLIGEATILRLKEIYDVLGDTDMSLETQLLDMGTKLSNIDIPLSSLAPEIGKYVSSALAAAAETQTIANTKAMDEQNEKLDTLIEVTFNNSQTTAEVKTAIDAAGRNTVNAVEESKATLK